MKRKQKKNVNIKDLTILKPLFWEYKWSSVKKNFKSPFVIARILELGNPQQFRLFVSVVGKESIRTFLNEKGEKLLSPQSFHFWKLYFRRDETKGRT